jgi:hypothetical protein
MKRARTVCVVLLLVGAGVLSLDARGPEGKANPPAASDKQQALVTQYCVTCHNERNKANAGNLAFDAVRVSDADANADTLERMVRKLRAGLMPPPGRPRPDPATYHDLLVSLQASLDAAAVRHPNPGRKDTFHRLNRTEYHNIIRDLLDTDIDVADLLPIDNPSFGFDNIAGTLTLNESLMEQYLSAAQVIGDVALGRNTVPVFKEFRAPYEMSQEERMEGFPMGTRGGLRASYNFPQDGEYNVEVKLMCGSIIVAESGCSGANYFYDPHELEVTVDGERVEVIVIKARGTAGGNAQEAYRLRVPVKAGPHVVAAWFIKQPSVDEYDGVRVKFDKPMHRSNAVSSDWQTIFQPYIASVTVGGPYNPTGAGDTPSRRRILLCDPSTAAAQTPCARRILSTLARRAYRRPVTAAEVDNLMSFYETGRGRGFESGIELGLRRILTSPNFLFRIERDPEGVAPDTNYRISDTELASRLSFFLWRSMPDDELLSLASQGQLKEPAVLVQQVTRMLRDDRAADMVSDFVGQWLQLRKVDVAMPNAQMFPNFDASLKADLRRETELFVDSIRREDRNVIDLLTADYTYLNERLATHYGVLGVKGSHFRRVQYPQGNPRRGLLGQASILTITSSPIRTRPVVRGKFILENLLGTPPPAPPANVPPLRETGNVLEMSMRERMAAHRSNPVCASCHSMIDPLGFALENFNPVGQYRKVDENFATIDASGTLPDGTKFSGLDDFRAALVRNPEMFVTTLTEKLMIYALGRGLEAYDYPAARKIVRDASASNYRFSSVVIGLVKSVPFQMRRSPAAAVVAKVAAR